MPDDPWDPPPFPKRGNRSSRALYEAIGRALSTWEELETMLAHLYAALCGCSQYDTEANHDYGEELNFRNRLAKLEHAGCRYFVKGPSQTLEGELAWVIRYVRGYSQRRNDVAHGVVRLLRMVLDPREGLLSEAVRMVPCPPAFPRGQICKPRHTGTHSNLA
jgi:hypothetical protein